MALTVIPDVVSGQTIRSLRPAATAQEAARLMREYDISAVVVLDDADRLVGIVTERDLARRVVAEDRQGSALPLGEVMSTKPAVIAAGASPFDALEQMRKLRVRHLPVVEGERVVGMISMRDLRHAINAAGGRGPGALARLLRAVTGGTR